MKRMSRPKLEPFPFDAVHDLLAVCRAMTLAAPVAARARRMRLDAIGAALVHALELAYAHAGDRASPGFHAAWDAAAQAVRSLGDEIEALLPASTLVAAEDTQLDGVRRRKRG